jgi:uncharacterized glyoxalase superfamily protein PhnB
MSVKPIPDGYKNVIPYLICTGTEKVIEFCQKAFDAKIAEMHKTDDGTIMHAAIHIKDSAIMLSEGSPKFPPMPSMLHIYVEDVDSVYKKAIAAGGVSLREPANEFYGDRSCGVRDGSGNQWWIATHIEDVSPEEMERRQKEMKR